jgi:hypothetical protein
VIRIGRKTLGKLAHSESVGGQKRVVPIDIGIGEFSPPLVLRMLRQFGFSDAEIEALFR